MKYILIILLLVSCEPKKIHDGSVTTNPYGYTKHCKNFPNSGFCKEMILKVFEQTKRLFIYKSDIKNYSKIDDWRSSADKVYNGIQFYGDCDDFAMTCADLLSRAGYPKDQIRIVECTTETGKRHLVCIAGGYLLDNRHNTIWPWDAFGYEYIRSMRLDELGTWRKISSRLETE